MKENFVYFVTTYKVSENGWLSDNVTLFGKLKDMLDWMGWNNLIFLNKDQIERVQHGRDAAIRSKGKNDTEKNSFVIGKIESKMIE